MSAAVERAPQKLFSGFFPAPGGKGVQKIRRVATASLPLIPFTLCKVESKRGSLAEQTEHPKKGAPAQVKGQGALDKNKQRVRRGSGGLLEMRGVSAHPSTREGGGGSALLGRLFLEVFEGFLS